MMNASTIRLRILVPAILVALLPVVMPRAAAFAGEAPGDPAWQDATYVAQVNAFVDAWHDDAAHARLAYFDKIAPDGVYIGTDRTERWTRDAFKAWAARFFERGSAWSFTPLHRNVAFTPDHAVAWFDEQLDSKMGVLQASGVVRARPGDGGLEIVHYQLSIAVPNDVQPKVSELIAGGRWKVGAMPGAGAWRRKPGCGRRYDMLKSYGELGSSRFSLSVV